MKAFSIAVAVTLVLAFICIPESSALPFNEVSKSTPPPPTFFASIFQDSEPRLAAAGAKLPFWEELTQRHPVTFKMRNVEHA